MKKITSFYLVIMLCLEASSQVKLPAPSPTQIIKQDFGIGTIELKYSRPGAKGRKIFGELVPYNKLWRTGANAATVIHFSDAVEIGGKRLDSGSYALYSIPAQDNWVIILNKGIANSGVTGYKDSDDVARLNIAPTSLKNKLETFTMQFSDIKPESCNLDIMWEKTIVSIPIQLSLRDKLKQQIEAALLTDKKPFWQAAQFYNEYEKNPAKALENVTKALGENPKAYWMWLYKAKIQQGNGDKAGALESSKQSLQYATEDKNEDYVRMNLAMQKKLK